MKKTRLANKTLFAWLAAVCLLATAYTCEKGDTAEGCGCQGPGTEVSGVEATIIKTSPFVLIRLDGLQRPVDPPDAWIYQVCGGIDSLPVQLQWVGAKVKVSGSSKLTCPNIRAPAASFKVSNIEPLTDNTK